MDILLYAAQKRQADLIQANNNLAATCTACKCTACRENYDTAYKQYCDTYYIPCTQTAYSCGYNNTAISFCGFSSAFWASSKSSEVACYNKCQQALYNNAWDTTLWTTIPRLSNSANTSDPGTGVTGLQVCSTNLYGGACCLWTVPSGASLIRFQMWGPGARSGQGCCCGGSPHGTTGAYASIIIPAIAGCTYTLCAGCACGTPIIWTSNAPGWTNDGGPTYITGYGLCNLCAQAGVGMQLYCRLMRDYRVNGVGTVCQWAAPDCVFSAGACICSCLVDFCFSGSCASCGLIPFACSSTTRYYGCYNGPLTAASCLAYAGVVSGLPGLHGAHCWDTSMYGLMFHPPIYGFETVSQCCICHAATTIGGIRCNHADFNYMRYPGAGGTGSAMFAGCTLQITSGGAVIGTACGGDIGRSGMICVSYC